MEATRTVHCLGQERTIVFRPGTSDAAVLNQVFSERQYGLTSLPCWEEIARRYRALLDEGRRPLIVDAGANIGAAAIWFSIMFPEALIVAIEPAPANVALLRRNARDVTIMEGAIASSPG